MSADKWLEMAIGALNSASHERHDAGAGLLEARALADLLSRIASEEHARGQRDMRERCIAACKDEKNARDPALGSYHEGMNAGAFNCEVRIRALPLTPAPQGEQPEPRVGDVWMVPVRLTEFIDRGDCLIFAWDMPDRDAGTVDWLLANGRLLKRATREGE